MNKKAVEKETVKTIQGAIITVIVVLLFVSVTSNLWAGTRRVDPVRNSLNKLYTTILEIEDGKNEAVILNFGNPETGLIRAYFGFNHGDTSLSHDRGSSYSLDLSRLDCMSGEYCICHCSISKIGEVYDFKSACKNVPKCISLEQETIRDPFMISIGNFGYSQVESSIKTVYVLKKGGVISVCEEIENDDCKVWVEPEIHYDPDMSDIHHSISGP